MQTIYLDLAVKNVPQLIYAKQGDVGRKFRAEIQDSGEAYLIGKDTVFTVWYSGTSGDGNYSAVGENSAVRAVGNVIEVELIAQMLTNYGGGTICLMMSSPDGSQIGLWNLPYLCEAVPGFGSEEAAAHYTALSEVAQKAVEAAASFTTDTELSTKGKAADANAVGQALAAKAPGGFGVGANIAEETQGISTLNDANLMTGFYSCTASTQDVPDDTFGGGPVFVINWQKNALCAQFLFSNDLTQMYYRSYKDGIWSSWAYLNPPMKAGESYPTLEFWNGKKVYTKLIDCGACENGSFISFGETLQVIRYCGTIGNVSVPAMIGAPGSATFYANFCVNDSGIQIFCSDSTDLIGKQTYCRIWYTKG